MIGKLSDGTFTILSTLNEYFFSDSTMASSSSSSSHLPPCEVDPNRLGRRTLLLAMVGLFLWQTCFSAYKYLEGGSTLTFESEFPDERRFPAVSLCPVMLNRSFGADDPFFATPMIDFVFAAKHGEHLNL